MTAKQYPTPAEREAAHPAHRLAATLTAIAATDPSRHGHTGPDTPEVTAQYARRNRLIWSALALACDAGIPAGVRYDPTDPRPVVIHIDLPTGQVSWHLPAHPNEWDGHSTATKYQRLEAFVRAHEPAAETGNAAEIGIESPDCIQVVMHPAHQMAYWAWLASRDLHLYRIPNLCEDDLPTYAVGLGAREHTQRSAPTGCSAFCRDVEDDRDRLAAELEQARRYLDTAHEVARSNKRHVAYLTGEFERVEAERAQLTAERDQARRDAESLKDDLAAAGEVITAARPVVDNSQLSRSALMTLADALAHYDTPPPYTAPAPGVATRAPETLDPWYDWSLPTPLPDLDDIERGWLSMCTIHDVGEPGSCSCPQGDPRQTIADLVSELRIRRVEVGHWMPTAPAPGVATRAEETVRGVQVTRPTERQGCGPDRPSRLTVAATAYADLIADKARQIVDQLLIASRPAPTRMSVEDGTYDITADEVADDDTRCPSRAATAAGTVARCTWSPGHPGQHAAGHARWDDTDDRVIGGDR